MILGANINEIRRLREDFELQASKYPDLALTLYYVAAQEAPPPVDFKSPNHAISLWQYVGTFTKDTVKDFSWTQWTQYGLPGAALSAYAVIHGPETELFRRMANRAGSLLADQIDNEVGTAVRRQFAVPAVFGRCVLVCNPNAMARWLNLLLFAVGKFQPKRLEYLTLPVDPFAASLAVFDHVLGDAERPRANSDGVVSASTGTINSEASADGSSQDADSQQPTVKTDRIAFGIVTALEKEPRQANLWVSSGSGRRPSV